MGGAASSKPFNVTFFSFPNNVTTIATLILIRPWIIIAGDIDNRLNYSSLEDDNGATTKTTSSPSDGSLRKRMPFNPKTILMSSALVTTFFFIFLLLLYIKHCNDVSNSRVIVHEKKNSGIDRAVVETLPVFRFGSLKGQKEGLDCAVCLTRFEDRDVLRLLPKCKHAFHVECVDTWLQAHSTCPLCRYKVNPEDMIVNVEKDVIDIERGIIENGNDDNENVPQPGNIGFRRVSGRHSSVEERGSGLSQVNTLQTPNESAHRDTRNTKTSSFRRSLDSASRKIKSGWFARSKRDFTASSLDGNGTSTDHRLEHRIIVSPSTTDGVHQEQQRWSDVQPSSNLLYLTSEMIISDPFSSRISRSNHDADDEMENRRRVRSVSEITGMNRFMSRNNRDGRRERKRQSASSRWLALFSKSQTRRDVQ